MRSRTKPLKDCPVRPACPVCGMHMIVTRRLIDAQHREQCAYECLRCGHTELSEPASYEERRGFG